MGFLGIHRQLSATLQLECSALGLQSGVETRLYNKRTATDDSATRHTMNYSPLSPTGYSSITETPRMSTPSTPSESRYEINNEADALSPDNAQTIENLLQALNNLSADNYVQRHQQNLDCVGSIHAIAGCQDQLQPGPDGRLHWERHYYCRGSNGAGYIYCKELTLDTIRLCENQTERLPTAIRLYQTAAEKYHDPIVWVDTFHITAQDGSDS